jgi:nucleotide-binding universal stress UspA family protein
MLVVEFKKVLCPIDLSELSIRSLAYAGAFAKLYDGELTALHVVPTFEPMEVRAGALYDPVRIVNPMSREEVLERLRQALGAAGVPTAHATLVTEAGEDAATIVDQAVTRRSDLVIMGTHGRSGFNRLLLGSVTEKVLRASPCPVLTVPPHAPAARPSDVAIRRILCPIDFSSAALQAFGFALDLARRTNASVNVLYVLEWLPEEEPRSLAHFNVPEYRQYLMGNARQQLEALIAQESPSAATDGTVVIGRAHREIVRAADTGVDLIVMGAQGRGGHVLPAFGSTTQQVVRVASCPVLSVHGA